MQCLTLFLMVVGLVVKLHKFSQMMDRSETLLCLKIPKEVDAVSLKIMKLLIRMFLNLILKSIICML
jgi:hypothetical protein